MAAFSESLCVVNQKTRYGNGCTCIAVYSSDAWRDGPMSSLLVLNPFDHQSQSLVSFSAPAPTRWVLCVLPTLTK